MKTNMKPVVTCRLFHIHPPIGTSISRAQGLCEEPFEYGHQVVPLCHSLKSVRDIAPGLKMQQASSVSS